MLPALDLPTLEDQHKQQLPPPALVCSIGMAFSQMFGALYKLTIIVITTIIITGGGDSCWQASHWKSWHNTDTGSSPQCGKGLFSQSASSADSLTMSVQPPCAIACINVYEHVTGSRTIVWTQENTAPITGMGSIAFVAAVPYPGKVTQISCKGQWSSRKSC